MIRLRSSGGGATAGHVRCGIDLVEVARMTRLLANADPEQLRVIFTDEEIADCGGRATEFAMRFAVKEACLKVFPRETSSKDLDFADVPTRPGPRIEVRGKLARLMKQYRYRRLAVSSAQTPEYACGWVLAE